MDARAAGSDGVRRGPRAQDRRARPEARPTRQPVPAADDGSPTSGDPRPGGGAAPVAGETIGLRIRGRLLPHPPPDDRREAAVEAGGRQAPGTHRDRKSTRLNSSHVKISYAVFCLKKKTKTADARPPPTNTS